MTRTLLLAIVAVMVGVDFVKAQAPNIDALPPRAFLRIGSAKLRHGDRVQCLEYSPDGTMLAAGGGNDPVRVWDAKSGDLIQAIEEPWVQALAFSATGHTLAFGGHHRVVHLWNFKLKKGVGRLEGHKAAIKAVAFSPDITAVVSGSQDGVIIIWDRQSNNKVVELKAHSGEVGALAFAPANSNVFASGGSDRVIHVWNMETNQSTRQLQAGCAIRALVFSADGKTLFSAGDDHFIRRWDLATGKVETFKGHQADVVTLALRGDTLFSGGLDDTCRVWHATSTKEIKTLPRPQRDGEALAVAPAGDVIATAGLNNAIRLFEVKGGNEISHGPSLPSGLVGLASLPAAKMLATVSADGQVLVCNGITGKVHKQWGTKQTGELLFALAPASKTLATAASEVRLWNVETGAPLGTLPSKSTDPLMALAFAPDGKMLATGIGDGRIDVWDLAMNTRVGSFRYPEALFALAWSPDGRKLAAGGGARIHVWALKTSELLRSFNIKEGLPPAAAGTIGPMVRTLAFGADSDTLAAGCWDGYIRIYNLNAKNPTDYRDQRICDGHRSAVFRLAFSPDGRTLVSGGFDRTVRLWEAFSGKQIAQLTGHHGAVHGVAFRADGRCVYSAGSDANILVWDVPGLSNNGTLPPLTIAPAELEQAWSTLASEETARGHDTLWRCVASHPQAVAFLTDEKRLFLLDPEKTKKLFRDLDSAHYPTRISAMNELASKKYGRWMEGRLDAVIANASSLEHRRRAEALKEKLNENKALPLAQERLRFRRILLMCEQAGSADARAALQRIADKGPEEELRDEAKASLQRLKK